MEAGRRNLLRLTVPALALLFSGAGRLAGQASPQSPFPQTREPEPPPKLDPRPLLKMNQKDIKRDVQRLFELAEELKKEVDKTNSAEVLSVSLVRKTEEIEKLAKHIRSLARG
jgi:hypothetical protein